MWVKNTVKEYITVNEKSIFNTTLSHRSVYLILVLVSLVLFACSSQSKATLTSAISQPPQANDSLEGTSWELASFGASGSETLILQGSTVTLQFDGQGQASGSGGCNSYGASYQVKGNTISFGDVISTLMACSLENINQQEQSYFQALKTAGKFEVSSDTLKIWYNNGQDVLNWQKK
jgi:heat shock protein HslJ